MWNACEAFRSDSDANVSFFFAFWLHDLMKIDLKVVASATVCSALLLLFVVGLGFVICAESN